MNKAPNCLVTTDETSFCSSLEVGDVLLFDTLQLASHIIKLIDNSPVNHCALYAGGGEVVHVGPTGGEATNGGAAHGDPLHKMLLSRKIRTVTAMRYIQTGDERDKDLGQRATDKAKPYLDDARYGYGDLLGLAAACFNRAYAGPWHSVVRLTVTAMSKAAQKASATFTRKQPAQYHLTCSEFVYSCYELAKPGCLEIVDPLATWRWVDGKLERQAAYWSAGSTDADWSLQFQSSEWEVLSLPSPDLEVDPPEGEDSAFSKELANEKDQILQAMINGLSDGKYGLEPFGPGSGDHAYAGAAAGVEPISPRADAPHAEAITPWDLWASPSLEVVRVLHFPPFPGDPVRGRLGRSGDPT